MNSAKQMAGRVNVVVRAPVHGCAPPLHEPRARLPWHIWGMRRPTQLGNAFDAAVVLDEMEWLDEVA
jgi:hypothetical protein